MAGVQELVQFKNAKKNYLAACTEFLNYHHENAREIWQWKKTGDADPDTIALYIEHSKAVDAWKKEIRILAQNMSKRKKENQL